MITTEEIGVRVFHLLKNSKVKSMITGSIGYQRDDYSNEDVVIVPHAITGEDSIRFGQIKVNIHVPDIVDKESKKKPSYKIDTKRLIEIRKEVINILKNHYEKGQGYNWTIGLISPPLKEPDHNEHFVSVSLDITARYKKNKQ